MSLLNAGVPAGDARVPLLDLSNAVGDEHFRDIGHADTKSLQVWVDVLVDHLRPLLSPKERE